MLKSQVNFSEPIARLEKVFNVSSLLPEKKSYRTSQNLNNNNNKCPFVINGHQRVRSESCINLSATKYKRKRKNSLDLIKLATIPRPDILHSYLSYREILQYLDYITLRFVDFVKIHTLGTTFERRSIKCIEINWNKANRARSAPLHYVGLKQLGDDDCSAKSGRNIVFIEGGTHAREWISVTVALNCIHQLTEKNIRHRDLLRKLKFYIVPVINPDGYEYTRNVNPRWRKNRRPHINDDYIGIDCNRNFDFHWDTNSSKTKRNTYQGDKPFSEHETKSLATILHRLSPNLLFFLSLHSYAQSIMYPWGYSKLLAKNTKLMESVAIAGRNAIKAYSGRYYRVGSISHITKRTIAGSVVDYAYGAVKIPLTLVMELPSSQYGFQPPAEKIHPLGIETWQGIREMCKKAYSLKAQIEAQEKERTKLDETKDEQFSLAKDAETDSLSNALKTTRDSEQDENKNRKDIKTHSSLQNNTLKFVQKEMSHGIIKSMLDVV